MDEQNILTPDITSNLEKYYDWWCALPRGAQEWSVGKWCTGDCLSHPINFNSETKELK